jgi:hypothetical protein
MKKKIPYGISNFKSLKLQKDWYYVDKTHFIKEIESESKYIYFLRPRRFGKSLSISMLENYYDIALDEQFEDIFADTFILDNPTSKRASYYILKFDFSAVDITDYERSFRNHITLVVDNFCDRYGLEKSSLNNPIDKLEKLLRDCNNNNFPLYLLIDEYDNFVTKLLIDDIEEYKGLVTSKSAIYKEFFSMLKVGTTLSIEKMFITGVSPLALYDVTSGSNIMKNISLNKRFNDMVGITKSELIEMIEYYELEDKQERIIDICDSWYNSYRFHKDINHTIYNSDMILYYIDSIIRTDEEPSSFIDSNVRTDYSKLKYLVYTSHKLNGNFKMLNQLLEGKSITLENIKESFSAFELTNSENFKSFMFSLGFMSMRKYRVALELYIPNQTIQKLLGEFIHYAYRDFSDYKIDIDTLNNHLLNLAYDKDLSVFEYLNEIMKESSSVRDYIEGENFIKAYLMIYLNFNSFYTLRSEVESNKGYIDLLLQPAKEEVPYGVMMELKYLKRSEFSQKLLAQKMNDAKSQLTQYDMGDRYLKVALVYNGWELVGCELVE